MALLMVLIATGAAVLDGAIGCGRNIPDVAGTYDLTETECPGVFADVVEITQSGDVLTFEPLGLSGSIDINGDFHVSNGEITCTGTFSEGTATGACTGEEIGECNIVYEIRE
jgi:hypothetical protein